MPDENELTFPCPERSDGEEERQHWKEEGGSPSRMIERVSPPRGNGSIAILLEE
jgi:hypothetical protein